MKFVNDVPVTPEIPTSIFLLSSIAATQFMTLLVVILLLIQTNTYGRHHRQIHPGSNSNKISLLPPKNLPHIEIAPPNRRHRDSIHTNNRTPIQPISFHQQLYRLSITRICECSDHFRGSDGEFAFYFEEDLAGGKLGVEGFVDGEEFRAETEEGGALGSGEFFAVGEGHGLASALDYFVAIFVDDVECVA